MQKQNQNESIQEYKKRADETLRKILEIRMRVQRKVDDVAYKKKLASLKG